MKICLINNLYRPYSRGGAEVVVENIIFGLKKQGHDVFLITLGRKDELENFEGLKIYRIKPTNISSFIDINSRPVWLRLFWHPLDVFNFSSYLKVKKILQQEKPEIIMTHNLKGIGFLIPKLIAKLNIKHVHTAHDVQLARPSGLIIYGQEKPFLIIDKVYEKICRWLFGSPAVFVSPSEWLLKYYKVRGFFYFSQKAVLKNPVVKPQSAQELPQAHRYGDKVIFSYIGQLEASKGILFLIETLKKLPTQNWELKIVGQGSIEQKLKQATDNDDRFKFYGYIKHSALAQIYHQTDLIVVPSFCYENSPSVIYESLSMGVPVIASDIGGIPELVKDNYNGFTFEPGNEKNLAEVLSYFLKHHEVIADLKKNTQPSSPGLDIDNYIKKLIGLLI
ncbi:MAG: glycosyltransferase [Patescibacteria group bacterium]